MNIRYAVLCERLRARARVDKFSFQCEIGDMESEIGEAHNAMSEEELLTIEEHLGFRLPDMLRTLYRVNGPGDFAIVSVGEQAQRLYEARQSKEERRPLRLAPELVEALRRQPGSYIALGEDVGIPASNPDRFLQLVIPALGGDPGLLLDGHTGHLYYDEFYIDFDLPDHEWSHLSFAAPSLEDWLERRLDSGFLSHVAYFPQRDRKLHAVRERDWLRPAEPDADTRLPLPPLEHTDAREETRRFREQTFQNAEPDPLEVAVNTQLLVLQHFAAMPPDQRQAVVDKAAAQGDLLPKANLARLERQLENYEKNPAHEVARLRKMYARDSRVKVELSGWRLEQIRHDLLREMYTLMEVLETEQEELQEEGEEGLSIGEEGFLSELRPLIDADTRLFALSQTISHGTSQLFLQSRVGFGLPHRNRLRWQQDLVTLSTSGQYKEADGGYARRLGRVPIEVPEVAELWLGRAQNERRWGKAEAKAGRREVACEHLALAVEHAERAIALAPKNRRYVKVLTTIQQALEASDLT